MNKYQEALDRIKTAPGFMGGTKEYRYSAQSSTPFLEDIEVLQELVDKEIPMKVTEKLDAPVSYEQYRKCPKCKDVVARMHSYCPFCGQKLDWSEDDDS